MVNLRRDNKVVFVIALIVMSITIANCAKDLKESEEASDSKEAPAPQQSMGSKLLGDVKGAAKKVAEKVKGTAEAAKGSAAPLASKVSDKVKGTVAPIGNKLGFKGSSGPTAAPSGPSVDVKASGAKADGKTDDSPAFMAAWKQACGQAGGSTILVPKGEYLVKELLLEGPCKGPITLEMNGNLKAPTEVPPQKPHCGWIELKKLQGFTLNGNGAIFDGQGSIAWKVNDCKETGKCNKLPINIRFTGLTNSKVSNILSTNSKLFHINVHDCKNFTLENVNIDAPAESMNTDGIHIGKSNGVNLIGGKIKTGDDCISIGCGTENLVVEGVECGPGHGISIGSLGKYPNELPLNGVTIKKCIIKNTDNGVRIKTWPGSPPSVASNILFEDITMDNVSLPILIDQVYCPHGKCKAGEPSRVKLSNVTFKNIKGTSATKIAVKLLGAPGGTCNHINLADIDLVHSGKEGPAVSACLNVKPALSGKMIPAACTEVAKADV